MAMIPLSPTDLEDLLNSLDEACMVIEMNGDFDLVDAITKIRYCQSMLKTAVRAFEEDLDMMYAEHQKRVTDDEQE